MRVYLPRFYVLDPARNLQQFRADVAEAAAAGAELAVFPEQFITGYRAANEPENIKAAFREASSRHPGMSLCCGTISEEGQNRQFWYRAGEKLACYTKVHLFRPNGEHELWEPGSRYLAIDCCGWRTGLGTCNDVRFPEQMHALSRGGKLQLLVYPALWPWERDYVWRSLLQARAIEHGAYCIGCCVAGIDNGLERFDGAGNYVFSPLGRIVYPHGRLYELDPTVFGGLTVDTAAEFVEAVCGP